MQSGFQVFLSLKAVYLGAKRQLMLELLIYNKQRMFWRVVTFLQ